MAERFVTPATAGRANYAGAVAKIAAGLGYRRLNDFQRHVARLQTERLEDGSWAYRTIAVTVPRQSGKTTIRGPVAIHRGLLKPGSKAWLTAQTREYARQTIVEDVQPRLARAPFAQIAAGGLRRSQGSEGIYLTNGSSWRVFAPAPDALHGTANEIVDIDEMWAIDELTGLALEQAAYPTFTTTGGQLCVISTAGTAARSGWLRRFVLTGRAAVAAGHRTGFAYVELGLPDNLRAEVEAGLRAKPHSTDWRHAVDLVIKDHPAHGSTLKPETIITAAEAMTVDDFLRAYCNLWTDASEQIIPPHLYAAARKSSVGELPARPAYGIAAGTDRADVAIAAAWRGVDGRAYAKLIHHQPGYTGALEAIRSHVPDPARAACASTGPVLELVDGNPAITRYSTHDYATACARLLSLIIDGALDLEASDPLDRAAAGAERRALDDAWAWGRRQSAVSVAALEAVTLALWHWDHRRRPAPAPAVVSAAGTETRS